MKKNITDIADEFEKSLNGGFEECFEEEGLANTFRECMQDYKKILKTCEEDGIDVGETEEKEFQEDFICGSSGDKEEIIDQIKERIVSLIEICDDVPQKLEEKYIKDLVDLLGVEDL